MTEDARLWVKSCTACAASTPHTPPPPMVLRETPGRVWQHVSMDFKGPVGGDYYLHVTIDNFSRFPVVQMTKSTDFKGLKDKLVETFSMYGIPESVTHDGGAPYNSDNWRKFAKQQGFTSRRCTPEHPRSNGIAERFMGVIKKTIHAAKAEGNDPRLEVQRLLINYRNTPHPSTGKSPAELVFRQAVRTRVPSMLKDAPNKVTQEAREMDADTRKKRKVVWDAKKRSKEPTVEKGDRVLLTQQQSSIKPPFDPSPYTVLKTNNNQVTVKRDGRLLKRDISKLKPLTPRLSQRSPTKFSVLAEVEELSDIEWEHIQASQAGRVELDEGEVAPGILDQVHLAAPEPEVEVVTENQDEENAENQGQDGRKVQLSPRQRKERKSKARARDKVADACKKLKERIH